MTQQRGRTIGLLVHHAYVALTKREQGDKTKDLAKALLNYWPSGEEAPPAATRDAVTAVKDASDDASLAAALRAFVDIAPPSLEPGLIWADTPVGVLLRGLFSRRGNICDLPVPKKLSASAMTFAPQSMIPTGWLVIRTN
jgi:hypothetical protein